MKHEINNCDLCGDEFEAEGEFYDGIVISDNNNIIQFEEVCFYCVGTIKSAIELCKRKNVRGYQKNQV